MKMKQFRPARMFLALIVISAFLRRSQSKINSNQEVVAAAYGNQFFPWLFQLGLGDSLHWFHNSLLFWQYIVCSFLFFRSPPLEWNLFFVLTMAVIFIWWVNMNYALMYSWHIQRFRTFFSLGPTQTRKSQTRLVTKSSPWMQRK